MAPLFNEKVRPYADDVNLEEGVGYDTFENSTPVYVPPRSLRRTRLQLAVLWGVFLAQGLVIVVLLDRVRSYESVHPPNLLYCASFVSSSALYTDR